MGRVRRGPDRMVDDVQIPLQSEFIINKVVSSNSTRGEVFSIQHYVIRFVIDFRQVSGFLPILQFPSPIKLTATV